MKRYEIEREGQLEFYRTFLPLINPSLKFNDILMDDNDGVLNGNILEFKLQISDLNSVLFQSIKYLAARRIKGKPVPANIVLVDLNAECAYLYRSVDYLSHIERVYMSSASKEDKGFISKPYNKKYIYSNQSDAAELIEELRTKKFTRIHLDENCIVGWAASFYNTMPTARKEDFLGDETGKHKTIGEIRNPSVFKEYIYPYRGKTNIKFQYLMDKLNDSLQKKNLGAFYTPELYAEKSYELLRKAIKRVPKGNDYIILDRCAGTGNLEKGLTDEELSHCILSTIEYYEYKVMQEILGSRVRHIIPPVESDDTFNAGLVRGADALSKEYLQNDIINKYIENPKCTVILFENPPYAETTSIEHQKKGKGKKASIWKNSFVVTEMKKEVKGTATNDLGNAFIWSGFKYYLRQPTDSYVVYSPVKYWKVQHLIDKEFLGGFAFNRYWFHTRINACVMVALWGQRNAKLSSLELEPYDINKAGELVELKSNLLVKRIYRNYSKDYFDKRKFPDDIAKGIVCGLNGTEHVITKRLKPITNDNILGYMAVYSSGFDNPDLHATLIRAGRYDGNGFYLRSDNYLEKLPMFCASRYITYNRAWTERARIMKSADGAKMFKDNLKTEQVDRWLKKCLLFTCLEMQNHIRTFVGSDEKFYRNELCLDTSNGETKASLELKKLKMNEQEKKLYDQWNLLLKYAKSTDEYNQNVTYGVYQIYDEIDTYYKDEETGEKIWKNIEVHSALKTLKDLLKDYYISEIVPYLFKYEFLK